jgi:hypothetical protein
MCLKQWLWKSWSSWAGRHKHPGNAAIAFTSATKSLSWHKSLASTFLYVHENGVRMMRADC